MELAHLMIEMTILSISALLALSNVFARLLERGRVMMVGAHCHKSTKFKRTTQNNNKSTNEGIRRRLLDNEPRKRDQQKRCFVW